ncbi:sensor domain-containing diguanylate cyclase [Sphingomonas jaspsi]|uniref:sensor domain-containing diguanylate cyclase n=1 Tax=Sphingomonas jaspsi TaxID=392409 RepID=UPI0004AF9961|nr:sensor domain-containing diguanylate cyclase [Sphingomonas jaspsi]
MTTVAPRSLAIAVGYFFVASMTIAFTRFGGGFATLWFATAYLSSALVSLPRHHWSASLTLCGISSALATGMFGLGWELSVPLALINMAEGFLAASLMRRRVASQTLDSLSWFGAFVIKVGVLAPMAGATLGAIVLWSAGKASLVTSWGTWFVGHSLGNLTFTPIWLLIWTGEVRKTLLSAKSHSTHEQVILYLIFLATTLFTFAQSRWPLLFLPLGPLTLICFRHGRVLPALSVATLGVVGGLFTAISHGPVALAARDAATQVQFFQFYLASVVLTILPVAADLRNRRKLMRAARESEARFRTVLDHSTDVVLHMQTDGKIIYASKSAGDLTGRTTSSLIGLNALCLVDAGWQEYVSQCHEQVLASRGANFRYEYMADTVDGESRWFETVSRAIMNENGRVESVISIVRDIDERKIDEQALVREVSTDSLTGLANRRAFEREFDKQVAGIRSVAIIDIDHFKSINDRYGHGGGDCALQTFAEVARRTMRKNDLIARIGGEEFAILFDGLRADQAFEICERLRIEMASAVTFYGPKHIKFTISAGITDVSSPDIAFVLARADQALYTAKREGRDQLRLAA